MAQYLIIAQDDTFVREIEAKNIKDAVRALVTDDAPNKVTFRIWRVAGPVKTVTLKVETSVQVKIT
jgi:hypothetical protein